MSQDPTLSADAATDGSFHFDLVEPGPDIFVDASGTEVENDKCWGAWDYVTVCDVPVEVELGPASPCPTPDAE